MSLNASYIRKRSISPTAATALRKKGIVKVRLIAPVAKEELKSNEKKEEGGKECRQSVGEAKKSRQQRTLGCRDKMRCIRFW